ncbi:MAG: molybdopterin dinucleotide-binding protein, partial [Coriobacteriales bacterium]|nr:molybdopterin dinucleotide-binding protein [Coriobacteriales bacterium]
LCALTGNWDTPAGMRGPTLGVYTQYGNFAQLAPALGLPSPEQFQKISGGIEFPTLQWWQWWADATACWEQMISGDPYPIVGGLNQSGDFLNLSTNLENWTALEGLDFFVDLDLWHTPLSGVSDLLLPVYHWLEVECPRGSQGSSGAGGSMIATVKAPGECKFDVEIIIGLGKAMGLPFWTGADPWPSVDVVRDDYVKDGYKDWNEYRTRFLNEGWFDCKVTAPELWDTYRRYMTGALRLIYGAPGTGLTTPTSKIEIWSTVIESHMPDWKEALPQFKMDPENKALSNSVHDKYPLTCVTGRRIPVYFHSEHRQLPWCRELWPCPRMEINPADAKELGLQQGDWAWIENDYGKVRQVVDIYPGIKKGFINAEHQWWFPELEQAGRGFQLSQINCLVPTYHEARCRICGSGYLRGYAVKVYKATPENSPFGNPVPCGADGTEIIHTPDDPRLKEWAVLDYEGR